MVVRIGYNVDTSSITYEEYIPALQTSNADAHLIMISNGGFFLKDGDLDTIRKVAAAVPNTTLIIRLYHKSEGNWSVTPSASLYKANWLWIKANLGAELMKRIVFDDASNEPNLGGDSVTAAELYVERCLPLVKAAGEAGVKLAIGAFSVGTPHESLLETVYAPLWKALAQYKQGISWHLYGAIPNEAGELVDISTVLDAQTARNAMTKSQWPISHQGWLMARPYRVIEYFRKNGLGIPDIYVTEAFIDNVFNASNSHIKESWKRRYASPQFPDPRGVRAWEKYLKGMFPEKAFDEAVAYLLSHARRNIFYHPAFKAVCLFALNAQWDYGYSWHPDGTHKEAASNFHRPEFNRFRSTLLPQVNAEIVPSIPIPPKEPPMPSPSNTLVPVRLRSTANATNIRAEQSATSAILGQISAVFADAFASENWSADGLLWVKVQLGLDGKTVTGYVSRQYVVIENRVIIPPPQEEIFEMNVLQGTIRGNKSLFTALAVLLDTLRDAAENPIRVE